MRHWRTALSAIAVTVVGGVIAGVMLYLLLPQPTPITVRPNVLSQLPPVAGPACVKIGGELVFDQDAVHHCDNPDCHGKPAGHSFLYVQGP